MPSYPVQRHRLPAARSVPRPRSGSGLRQQRGRGDQHARRAEPALHAAVLQERALQVASSSGGASPSTVVISRPRPAARGTSRSSRAGRRAASCRRRIRSRRSPPWRRSVRPVAHGVEQARVRLDLDRVVDSVYAERRGDLHFKPPCVVVLAGTGTAPPVARRRRPRSRAVRSRPPSRCGSQPTREHRRSAGRVGDPPRRLSAWRPARRLSRPAPARRPDPLDRRRQCGDRDPRVGDAAVRDPQHVRSRRRPRSPSGGGTRAGRRRSRFPRPGTGHERTRAARRGGRSSARPLEQLIDAELPRAVGPAQRDRRPEAQQRPAGLHRRRRVHHVAPDRSKCACRVRTDDRATRRRGRSTGCGTVVVDRELGMADERAEFQRRRPLLGPFELVEPVDRDQRLGQRCFALPGADDDVGAAGDDPRPLVSSSRPRRRSMRPAASVHRLASQIRSGVIGSRWMRVPIAFAIPLAIAPGVGTQAARRSPWIRSVRRPPRGPRPTRSRSAARRPP